MTTPFTLIHRNVAACRAGAFAPLICRMPSGWAVLCDMQYLRGYTILLADPVVPSLNALERAARAAYLLDMAVIGDALLEVTGACRINYATMGNSEPALHTHIVPRYSSEPDANRKIGPWSYPDEILHGTPFDPARDAELIAQLARAIQKRV